MTLNTMSSNIPAHPCPSCGTDLSQAFATAAETPQRRIAELETQVRILTDKATAAVDKLADYEDELRQLKSNPQKSSDPQSQQHHDPPPRPTSATALARSPLQSRLSSLLPSSRRSISQPPTSSAPSTPLPTQLGHSHNLSSVSSLSAPINGTDEESLKTALQAEHTLRVDLEKKLEAQGQEVEELSAQLFMEANEMVARERRALASLQGAYSELQSQWREVEMRVKEKGQGKLNGGEGWEREKSALEERVRMLEGKGRRWEELERRVGRVERVRGILGGEGDKDGEEGRRPISEGAQG